MVRGPEYYNLSSIPPRNLRKLSIYPTPTFTINSRPDHIHTALYQTSQKCNSERNDDAYDNLISLAKVVPVTARWWYRTCRWASCAGRTKLCNARVPTSFVRIAALDIISHFPHSHPQPVVCYSWESGYSHPRSREYNRFRDVFGDYNLRLEAHSICGSGKCGGYNSLGGD